ncbi:Hint domain-containing protein [Asaia krungthepensis]|uniref:Hedgehog/Intein (Hint) domain-containing protein n=1 Tax=Asaia krungthepensis NRIC 0535 TaxID=1307925 RepID=A0ABQ0Q055_9PROT|nr:Hint domain-containing protein [Asaia krungthepensis]GBQ85892.1 hypothetical protein AA0535_0887 [Asaia krungthepensis NRIC 0535]
MERSGDSQFNGSQSYSVDGGTFTVKSSSLPQGGSYHAYDLALGQNGGTFYVDINALTSGGKKWVFNVSLPQGSTGVDISFFCINNSNRSISVSDSYDSKTNTYHLHFSTIGVSNELAYIELVLPGYPWAGGASGGLLVPGAKFYSDKPGYCFLAGALIETEDGEVPVEKLVAGQKVMTYDAKGEPAGLQAITWSGCKASVVQDTGHPDVDKRPICILAGAFGSDAPRSDLLVTPEHCFLIDGMFVPARMLVNHRSIFYRDDLPRYEYYHFKTAGHAIICANGALTETLRDDISRFSAGSRSENENELVALAAPLCRDVSVAKGIHDRLDQMATRAGLASMAPMKTLIGNPDLHLILANGERVDPLRVNDRWAVFSIPADQAGAHIVSRHSRPCDVVGPFLDDRRELGICVGEVTIFGADTSTVVTEHLQGTAETGWCQRAEGELGRWTAGCAWLDFGTTTETQGLLTIEVLQAGPYLETAPVCLVERKAA